MRDRGLAALYLIPKPTELKSATFDWPGVALLGLVALGSVKMVASLHDQGLTSMWTVLYAALTLSALYLFARHARRAAHPIVRLDIFRDRAFAMGTIVSLVYGFGIYASSYLVPIFLQSALGFSATAAGLALMPGGITLVATLPVAGHMADRYPPRLITMCGLGVFCLSFMLLARMGTRVSYTELIAFIVLGRFGLGMILPSLTLASLRDMQKHQLGESSMVVSYLRDNLAGSMAWRRRPFSGIAPFRPRPGSFRVIQRLFGNLCADYGRLCACLAGCQPHENPKTVLNPVSKQQQCFVDAGICRRNTMRRQAGIFRGGRA